LKTLSHKGRKLQQYKVFFGEFKKYWVNVTSLKPPSEWIPVLGNSGSSLNLLTSVIAAALGCGFLTKAETRLSNSSETLELFSGAAGTMATSMAFAPLDFSQ
jgi:hypothetical protein